jgi:hypothetical protein
MLLSTFLAAACACDSACVAISLTDDSDVNHDMAAGRCDDR